MLEKGTSMSQRKIRSFFCAMMIMTLMIDRFGIIANATGNGSSDAPSLTLQATYSNRDKDGSFDLELEIGFSHGSGSRQSDHAENVTVYADGTNGLTPEKSIIELGDIESTVTAAVHYTYQEPEGSLHPADEHPEILIRVASENCGELNYSCEVDVQPKARYLVFYRYGNDVGFGDSIAKSADTVKGVFDGKRFDGSNVEGKLCGVNPAAGQYIDSPGNLDSLETYSTDENDITYIYVATHGVTNDHKPTSQIQLEKTDGHYITVEEILSYIDEHVSGRAVILFDNCFSGTAVKFAESSGMDPERFFIASSTTSDTTAGTATFSNMMELAHLLGRLNDQTSGSASCQQLKDIAKHPAEIAGLVLDQALVAFGKMAAFYLYSASMPNAERNISELLLPSEYCDQFPQLKPLKMLLDATINLFSLIESPGYLVRQLTHKIFPQIDSIDDKIWWGLIAGPWQINIPQFYGNRELPLIFNDRDYDDHVRLPVIITETEKITHESRAGDSDNDLMTLLTTHYWYCGIQSPQIMEFFEDGTCVQYGCVPEGKGYDETYVYDFENLYYAVTYTGTYTIEGDKLVIDRVYNGETFTTAYYYHDADDPDPEEPGYNVSEYVTNMYRGTHYFYETGYIKPDIIDPFSYVPAEYLGLLGAK